MVSGIVNTKIEIAISDFSKFVYSNCQAFSSDACKILGFSVWMRQKTAASGLAKAFTFFTTILFEIQ
jgi:hypothetical protein